MLKKIAITMLTLSIIGVIIAGSNNEAQRYLKSVPAGGGTKVGGYGKIETTPIPYKYTDQYIAPKLDSASKYHATVTQPPPTTYVFTFQDLVLFSYTDNTNFEVYDAGGTLIWNGTLNQNEYQTLSPGSGIYKVAGSEPFSLIVGDPISRGVLGYFAVNNESRPLATKLLTYMPPPYFNGELFIVFSYQDNTQVTITNLNTGIPLWSGTLNDGQHTSLGISSIPIQVTATNPVSALTYTDQGYYIPADNGTFIGTHFYGYVGYIGNWQNDLNIIGYYDNTNVTVTNTQTSATYWSGTVNEGSVHTVTVQNVYVTIDSDQPVTAVVTPYSSWGGYYYHCVRAIDRGGLGIGTLFYICAIDGGQLDILAFEDGTNVTVTRLPAGTTVWTGTLNEGEHQQVNTGYDLYKVESSGGVAIFESWGGSWGADFAPLQYAISECDVGITDAIVPTESVFVNTKYFPTVMLTNFIQEITEAFTCTLLIEDDDANVIYLEGLGVDGFAGGEEREIFFGEWIVSPKVGEIYTLYATSYLPCDENPDNDTWVWEVKSVARGALDVGVLKINTPSSVTAGEAIKPDVTVQNYGELAATFDVICQIQPSSTRQVYEDTATINDLASGDTAKVVFKDWTPDAGSSVMWVKTFLIGDMNAANDSLEKTINAVGIAEAMVPTEFALSCIKPNPFSLNTEISYQVPHSSKVSLAVYDVSGKLMKTLVTGTKETGSYTVSWNGRDISDKSVPAGIYFIKFETQGYKITRKLVLLTR